MNISWGTSKSMSKNRQIVYLSNEIKLFNWLYFHKKFSSRQQTFNTKVFYAVILFIIYKNTHGDWEYTCHYHLLLINHYIEIICWICCCWLWILQLKREHDQIVLFSDKGTIGILSQLQISIMVPSGSWKNNWST